MPCICNKHLANGNCMVVFVLHWGEFSTPPIIQPRQHHSIYFPHILLNASGLKLNPTDLMLSCSNWFWLCDQLHSSWKVGQVNGISQTFWINRLKINSRLAELQQFHFLIQQAQNLYRGYVLGVVPKVKITYCMGFNGWRDCQSHFSFLSPLKKISSLLCT